MKITLLTGRTFDLAAELGMEIKVLKSPLAKRLTLRIDDKNRIPVLTIPRYCSARKAVEFVDSHRDWIQNMLARLPAAACFENGECITLMGQKVIIMHRPGQRGAVIKDGFLIVGGEPEFLHRRVCDFIKKYAAKELYKRSCTKAKQIGCSVRRVTLKDTKSRWGSCSSRQNINYNWRIVLAPAHVIDYLVCHEVAHLAHQDHSPAFWECVASLCPDYEDGRRWLKIRGKELYRYL